MMFRSIRKLQSKFMKKTSHKKGPCNVCDPVKKENCLIRKRAANRKIQSPVPDTVPVSKTAGQDRTNSRIDRVISAVMIGIKDLDDICIACCEEGVELACNHPLFIGKICKKCKKDVKQVWSLPSGKFHKTSHKKGPCNVCDPVKKENCLIRKRAANRKIQSPVPDTVPVSKTAGQDRTNSRIDRVISAVMIGIKDLDDICIACCEEGVELACNHPLFIGKICKKCKKDVKQVWSLPSGKFHNFCTLCGQGGSIVCCSNDICSRAFCKECIEYLDCEDTVDEVIFKDGRSRKPNINGSFNIDPERVIQKFRKF